MLSRFFIDRPIFATVISVVIVLAGVVAFVTLPVAQYPEVTPPTVQVTALYPGANAETLRDVVAAPIEEQVSGVEGMVYMSSQCTNDGAYNLTITFKLGMNSDMAQVLVQNRVSLALPVIPALVQNEGINVRKTLPNTMMIVNLISPSGRYDSTFLSNYATIFIRDELGRLPGVAGISYLGQRDYSLRAWLDPDKLAALRLSAMDVVTAISQQNVQIAAGQIGQPPVPQGQQFQLTINTLGRLTDPEQFENIIVKAGQLAPTAAAFGGTTGSSASSGSSAASPQFTGIVRLRDVVRENRYYFEIALDAARLANHGLEPADVARALRADEFTVQSIAEARSTTAPNVSLVAYIKQSSAPLVDELADIQVPNDEGQGSHLGDLIAPQDGIVHLESRDELGVQLGSQQYDQTCTLDTKPSVALSIYQLPGSNALQTADGVYAKMKELKTRFPDGLDYQIVYDTTPFINESVDEVYSTLIDAVILVAIVVLFFLQDWRAMILPHDRRARLADRHVRGHGALGFHAQQSDAVRPGAGDRHRRGRRHRGAGEHRAADRDRPGREDCDDPGHGRNHGAGLRHHPGP